MPKVKLSGILQMEVPSNVKETIRGLLSQLPSEARPLKEEDLHITLFKVPKERRKDMAAAMQGPAFEALCAIEPIIIPRIARIHRSDALLSQERTSWVIPIRNVGALRHARGKLLAEAGIEPNWYEQHDRWFHVSIANLTGSPFDSVGDVTFEDILDQLAPG